MSVTDNPPVAAIVDLFVHEDLSKPENRINVALFELLMLCPFRTWLLDRLCQPQNAVMYPTASVAVDARWLRPDFVVRDGPTLETLAWIEVECTSEIE